MSATHKEKFVIIDGNALLHRAFHALPPLTTKKGMLVNAVYGFALTLLKILKELKPAYLAAAFDTAAPTFRDEAYEDYKAHRVKQPQELYDQIPLIKEMITAFNLPVIEMDGFEADDVIGTLASKVTKARRHEGTKENIEVIIVTGDMDALQLVNEHVRVYTFRKGFSDTMIFDAAAVKERYGLTPAQIIDYKALRGDPSDNIPGIKGIGEKTATALLQQFSTLDDIYTSLSAGNIEGVKPGVLEKLKSGKKDAMLSRMLATIKTDAPIAFTLDDARVGAFDTATIISLFQEWGFQSLAAKLAPLTTAPSPAVPSPPDQHTPSTHPPSAQASFLFSQKPAVTKREWRSVGYHLIDDETKLTHFLAQLRAQKGFVVDTETTGIDPFHATLLGFSFCWKEGEAYYVNLKSESQKVIKSLKPIFEDAKIEKWGHNVKYDLEVLRHAGIQTQGFTFDTMIASYLLNPGSRQHNLDTAVFSEFGYQMQPIEELIGKGKNQITLAEVPLADVANYSCEDADYTFRLIAPYRARLKDCDNLALLNTIEMPLIPVLADMEEAGVQIDEATLAAQAKTTRASLKKLETRIYRAAGATFNINSPLQLKEILFTRLKLSPAGLGKTKTGISTAAEELEKLKDAHPIIPLIMEYRELFKLLSTYLEALPEQIDRETGRIHTDYNQTVAATGRLSSSNPNLQNIPIRTELGRNIRKAFVAARGFRLIAADYSQFELRIAASIADDTALITSFHRNEDIHKRTASNVLGVPYDEVTQDQRRQAKAINFGILYGLGARGLAAGSGLTLPQAKDFIERYFRVHRGIKAYVDRTIEEAREKGFVETLNGRRRYLPEITAEHQGIRAAAERMAINHPIQGSQADFIKQAMINIDKRLRKEFTLSDMRPLDRPVHILLQVHDELVFEVKTDLVEQASHIIKEEMEHVARLKVPIEVHLGVGKNWDECK